MLHRIITRHAAMVHSVLLAEMDETMEHAVQGRFLRNSCYIVLSRMTTFLGSIGLYFLIGHFLSIEEFGFYIIITAMVSMCAPLMDAGQEHLLVRELPRQGSMKPLSITISVRVMMTGVFVVFLVAFVQIGDFDNIDPSLVILMAAATFLNIGISSLLRVIFVVTEDVRKDLILSIVVQAFRLTAVTLVLIFGMGLAGVFIVQFLAELIGVLSAWVLIGSARPHFVFSQFWNDVSAYAWQGLPIMFLILLNELSRHGDVMIVTYFLGESAAGIFGAASRIVGAVLIASCSVVWLLAPRLSRIESEPLEQQQSMLQRVTRLIILLWLVPVIAAAVHSSLIMRLFGRGFHDGAPVLSVLVLSVIPQLLVYFFSLVLIMRQRQRVMSCVFLCFLLFNFLVDILLVPWLGIVGAAIGKFLSQGFCFLVFIQLLRPSLTLSDIVSVCVRAVLIVCICYPVLWFALTLHYFLSLFMAFPLIIVMIVLLGQLRRDDIELLSLERLPIVGPLLSGMLFRDN